MNDLSTMKGCLQEAAEIIKDAMCDLDEDDQEEYFTVVGGVVAAIGALEYYEGFQILLDKKDESIRKEIDSEWQRLKKASIDRVLFDGELEGIEYETDD